MSISTYESGSAYNYNQSFYNSIKVRSEDLENMYVISVPPSIYGNNIKPNTLVLSSSIYYIKDDGEGNLFDYRYSPQEYVGNVVYSHGMVIMVTGSAFTSSVPLLGEETCSISFKNAYTVFENQIKCTIKDSDFTLTLNPTIQDSSGSVSTWATGSDFSPYLTTIGLYNENQELVMVAKLGQATKLSPNTDMNFIIKWDY